MGESKIVKMQIDNFRNLQGGVIPFSPYVNCISGKNGNGKTNVLEAVHLLATGQSFRKNAGLEQFLTIGGEGEEIVFSSLFAEGDGNHISYSGRLRVDLSQWFCNGKAVKRKVRHPVLFINPHDGHLFHTGPGVRRNWFDRHIAMLSPPYKKELGRYNKLIRFRNGLLKDKPFNYRKQIGAMDRELAKSSKIITAQRVEFLEEISPWWQEAFCHIFAEEHLVRPQLDGRVVGLGEEDIFKMLQDRFGRDDGAGFTTYGIHRDDYRVLLDGQCAFDYASLGQQKMLYLGLLFAYIRNFWYKCNSYPIVLVDDVSGELDGLRWMGLVDYLTEGDFQVLVTTANISFQRELENRGRVNKLMVTGGRVEQVNGIH